MTMRMMTTPTYIAFFNSPMSITHPTHLIVHDFTIILITFRKKYKLRSFYYIILFLPPANPHPCKSCLSK